MAEKVIGQYRFQVEEFVPDRIKVEIAPPQEQRGAGRGARLRGAESTYLFGPPAGEPAGREPGAAGGLDVRAQGVRGVLVPQRRAQARRPRGARPSRARSTRRARRTLPRDHAGGRAGAVVAGGGDHGARVRSRAGAGSRRSPRLRVASLSLLRRAAPARRGVRRPGPGRSSSSTWRSRPTARRCAVRRAAGRSLPGPLEHGAAPEPGGGYRYESTRDPVLVDTQAIPAGKARGRSASRRASSASYRVVLTDPETQASAEVEFFVAGWGYSPWAIKNPARLELALDKEEYAPGETATVQVRAPFSGQAAADRGARPGARHARSTPWTATRRRSTCRSRPTTGRTPTSRRRWCGGGRTWSRGRPGAPSGRCRSAGRPDGEPADARDRRRREEMRPSRELDDRRQDGSRARWSRWRRSTRASSSSSPRRRRSRSSSSTGKLALGVTSYDTLQPAAARGEARRPAGGGEGEEGMSPVRADGGHPPGRAGGLLVRPA